MNREPLQIGERVRDGLGHWWIVKSLITPWIYVVESVNYPGATAKATRSELRKDGE